MAPHQLVHQIVGLPRSNPFHQDIQLQSSLRYNQLNTHVLTHVRIRAMQSSIFQIDSHQLSCQHIREYPGATTDDQSTVLQLAIKEYRPRDNLIPSNGDITIIGAHANGFPKVCRVVTLIFLHAHHSRAGNVRALVGGTLSSIEEVWYQNSRNMDCRHFTPRSKWCA